MNYDTDKTTCLPETELMPCPFCGGAAQIAKHFKDDVWRLQHRCRVMGYMELDWHSDPGRLIRKWNTRTPT